MILHRLAEHLKAQNWTVVAIEFLIVVAGVYIGVFLGAARDQHTLKGAARVSMNNLLDDLIADRAETAFVVERQNARIAAAEALDAELEKAAPDFQKAHDDLLTVVYNNRTLFPRTTYYDALLREGELDTVPADIRRQISHLYGYRLPAIVHSGAMADQNDNLVYTVCIGRYWDLSHARPASEDPADMTHFRNCVRSLHGFSQYYADRAGAQMLPEMDRLIANLADELDRDADVPAPQAP